MACLNRMFARMATGGGWAPLVLVLVLAVAQVYAQDAPPRMHGGPDRELPDPSAYSAQTAPAKPAPAQPVPHTPRRPRNRRPLPW